MSDHKHTPEPWIIGKINQVTPCPPQDIQISAVKIGEWFIENNLTDWKLGHCASRELAETLEKQRDLLLEALEDMISPMASEAEGGLGELAEKVAKAKAAIASVKGGAA